jgi:hypothetical protein
VETGRDWPKIIVKTKNDVFEFPYRSDGDRDEALRELTEVIKIHQQESNGSKGEQDKTISINVADSSNVNIITQSSSVKISQHQEKEAKDLIGKIREAIGKEREIDRVLVEEIGECLDDIEAKIENQAKIPRLTFKGLLENTANFSEVSNFVISLGQVLNMIPT